jgi:transposase
MCYVGIMEFEFTNLPEEDAIPKDVVISLIKEIQAKTQEKYQAEIEYLQEQIRLLRNEVFGRSSEKTIFEHPDQRPLFELSSDESGTDPAPVEDAIEVGAHKRKKRGRKPLPDHLPRVEIIHDLSDEEKICGCGKQKDCIGKEQCEKIDYIPAKVQVQRHIRLKYACKDCEGVEDDGPTITIAPAPVQLLPKSNATAGLLAHLFVSKFADALPFYRQQKIFARHGLDLPRATMSNWAIGAADYCKPLIELLTGEIRSGPVINIDETTLQVLGEPGKSNTSKSYVWIYRGGDPQRPCLVYQYHPTRSGQVAIDFIGKDYHGYVQTDDFSGYSSRFENKKHIVHLGCWAHSRRKFFDVVKAKTKHRGKRQNPQSLADEALLEIRQLYEIEKQARNQSLEPDQIKALRQAHSKPILDRFKQWLDEKEPLVPPKSLLGIAIGYALSNWSKLIVYIEDGCLRPDNNLVENAIRPFVVGRKNFLFSGGPRGAEASCVFYSLIETAKANGLEPFGYLRYIFERLPLIDNPNDYKKLLPQNLDNAMIESATTSV